MRLPVVEATKAGMKRGQPSLRLLRASRTVFRWLADFYKGGEQALKAKPTPGRPPTLSLLRELIRHQFCQTLALSSVSRVMSLLGPVNAN